MNEWCTNTWIDIVKVLNSDIYSGLNDEQVKENITKYGKNQIEIPKVKGIFKRVIEQFLKLWILILFFTSLVFLYNKDYVYFAILICLVVINVWINAFSKFKYDKRIKELKKIHLGTTRVIRSGKICQIPSDEVVIGDIVLLKAGDLVPADLRIVESENLKVKESVITGEKYIVEKYETKIEGRELSLSEMKNILFKSSYIIEGQGKGIVIAIGKNTQISNVISMLVEENQENEEKYLLEKNIEKILNLFSLIVLICSSIIFVFNYFVNINLMDNILSITNIMLSSIPQGIIIIIMLISIILIIKFGKVGINIKNLSVVEAFSHVNLLCFDKLGALTENSMILKKMYTCDKYIEADNFVLEEEEDISINVNRILNIGVLCNDTEVKFDLLTNPKNDLMEIGFVKYATNNNVRKKELDLSYPEIMQIPYDTDRRVMTTINRVGTNFRANIKGALDTLLDGCTHIMVDGIEREITEDDIKNIKNADIAMSSEGLNVIGTAYRNFNYQPTLNENIESNLVFVGLVAFMNPVNKLAMENMRICKKMGIRPIVMTEENKFTALASGKEMGILRSDEEILSGVEIDNMDEEEFKRMFKKIKIFSRIDSKHKAVIMKHYKELNCITSIAGYKFTDLPSLQIANIGINYGNSEMLKKIADISLENIQFNNIINLIIKCRKIMNSIIKVILYIFSCSIMQFMITTLSNVLLHKEPLRIGQIVWTNIFSVIIPCLIIMMCYYDDSAKIPKRINKDILYENKLSILLNALFGAVVSYIPLFVNSIDVLKNKQNWVFLALNLSIITVVFNYIDKKALKNKFIISFLILDFVIQILAFTVSVVLSGRYVNIYSDWIYILPITLWIIFSILYKLFKVKEEV